MKDEKGAEEFRVVSVQHAENIDNLIAERDELQARVQELSELAYIGEHEFPELTWKYRCKELRDRIAELESGRGLPAQPTGGDVEVLIDQLDDYIARINGDDNGSNATVNELRGHLTRLQAEVDLWKGRTTNICQAHADLQSELTNVRFLVDQALHLQNEHYYDDGVGLHLAMIKWARTANEALNGDK